MQLWDEICGGGSKMKKMQKTFPCYIKSTLQGKGARSQVLRTCNVTVILGSVALKSLRFRMLGSLCRQDIEQPRFLFEFALS